MHTIKTIIDRIEGDKVILKTEDGLSVIWPKDKLPQKISEGMSFIFEITEAKEHEEKKRKLAKDILNEILDTNS